jgi:hypothetical protein
VGEAQMGDADGSAHHGGSGQRAAHDVRLGVEDGAKTLISSTSALHDGGHEAEREERPREALQGEPEGHEVAARHVALDHEPAAVPEHHQHARGADGAHHRAHQPADAREGEALLEVSLVGLLESARLGLFEGEAAHHAHAGEARQHAIAHLADGLLVLAVAQEELPRERARDEHQHGQQHQGRERQLQRHVDHDPHGAADGEDGARHVEHAEAEQQPHLREVVRRAAHDLARGHAPEERGAELVQTREQDGAQLVLDVAATREDGDAGEHAHERRAHGRHQHEQGRELGGLRAPLGERVDGALHEEVALGHQQLLHREQQRAAREEPRVTLELGAETDGK